MIKLYPIYNATMETDLAYDSGTGFFGVLDAADVFLPLFRGYSGHGDSINEPDDEKKKSLGPIPRGTWLLDPPRHHERLGPVCIGLEADGWKPYGRSAFFIHGDNKRGDGSASTGCIILNRASRDVISAMYWAGWRRLIVFAR